jgi:hypothetical protein
MKPKFILSYLSRYWELLLLLAVAAVAALSNTLFQILGTIVYVPVLVLAAAASALLVRHLVFRNTLDDFAHNYFIDTWRPLDNKLKLIITLAVLSVIYLGACIIASGLIR